MSNFFMGQQNALFNQSQNQVPSFGPLISQNQGGGLFNQPQQQQQQQQQNPTSIFGNQQLPNQLQPQTTQVLQPQGSFLFPQLQQQNQAFNFQQGPLSANIKNISQMVDNLKEKKNNIKKIFDDLNAPQSKQYLGNFDLTKLMNLETQKLLEGTKLLMIQQHDLVRRLEEFITALGLIENQSNNGIQAIRLFKFNQIIYHKQKKRGVNTEFKELQGAEQILTSTLQRLDINGDNRYYGYTQNDVSVFQVPQDYEQGLIMNISKQVESISQAILKLQEFNQGYLYSNLYIIKVNQLNLDDVEDQDFDDIVDNYLQKKLLRIANLSHLLFSLQQKICYIHQKSIELEILIIYYHLIKIINQLIFNINKQLRILELNKNRKLNDYHSIDSSKDQLQTIISQEINI